MEQLERIKAYAKDYRRVPIAKEIFADVRTVIGTLRVLKKVSRTVFLFEARTIPSDGDAIPSWDMIQSLSSS